MSAAAVLRNRRHERPAARGGKPTALTQRSRPRPAGTHKRSPTAPPSARSPSFCEGHGHGPSHRMKIGGPARRRGGDKPLPYDLYGKCGISPSGMRKGPSTRASAKALLNKRSLAQFTVERNERFRVTRRVRVMTQRLPGRLDGPLLSQVQPASGHPEKTTSRLRREPRG